MANFVMYPVHIIVTGIMFYCLCLLAFCSCVMVVVLGQSFDCQFHCETRIHANVNVV